MTEALLVLLLSSARAQDAAKDCTEYLQAFTTWDIEIGGKIVPRAKTEDVPDWDSESVYDGIALAGTNTPGIKRPSLEIGFQPKDKKASGKSAVFKKTEPLTADPGLRAFTEFKPREFFSFDKPGKYEVRLKDGDSLLCSSAHQYRPN